MHILTRVVPFPQALRKSKPVGQEGEQSVEFLSADALLRQVNLSAVFPVVLRPCKVAINDHGLLQRCRDARNNISQEEVSESHNAERTDQNVAERIQNLNACRSVEHRERVQAGNKEENQQCKRVGRPVIKEPNVHLYFSCLPHKASHPNKRENQRDSVHLMVDNFVFWVNFEDESVIHRALAEDLNTHSRAEENEHNYHREDVGFNARAEHVPRFLVVTLLRLQQEENEEHDRDNNHANEECDLYCIFDSYLVVLSVQLFLSIHLLPITENIRIEC
jgi:hypothetical protein